MVFRDLFSVMLTHWRLLPVWSPVLFCALRRFFSNRQPVLQQKRRPLPTGAMLPLKMNAFAHFVFKKDLIQQIRLNRTMCVRACQSFFCRTRCKKEGLRPPLLPITGAYTVPVTISSLTPGVTAHAPVTGSWVYVAAGTVICPAVVANSPVVPS